MEPEAKESTAKDPGRQADAIDDGDLQPWWRRSAQLGAGAALAIGFGTLWFGNMLKRVPLDEQSTLGYLLMLPLLFIVPAFSAAGLRLAWLAYGNSQVANRFLVAGVALVAAVVNLLAISRFIAALLRIFTN